MTQTVSERPRRQIEPGPLERILDRLAWTGLVVNVLLLAVYWSELPDRVPIHFGWSGEADAWGGRLWLLSIPAVSLGLLLLLRWLEGLPHLYNYPWPVTEENAESQYRLARELVVFLRAASSWIFALVSLEQCRVALGHGPVLGGHLFPAALLVPLLLVAVYVVRMHRAR